MVTETDVIAGLASASAPAKAILLGEHSVVYGRSALAVPVRGVEVQATVHASDKPLTIRSLVVAADGQIDTLAEIDVATAAESPLAIAARSALSALDVRSFPTWRVELRSTIPVAAGMGSSAAVAVATIRALASAAGRTLDPECVSDLAYEAECCAHGSPSGIDNTVVALEQPICFEQGDFSPLALRSDLPLVIADTGERSPTREVVAAVRERYRKRPRLHDSWFDQIAGLVRDAVAALADGELRQVGWAMNSNHLILQALGVSTPRLDSLVAAARDAGALGAKLSGAGGGGIVLALTEGAESPNVLQAMRDAGAALVTHTVVAGSDAEVAQ